VPPSAAAHARAAPPSARSPSSRTPESPRRGDSSLSTTTRSSCAGRGVLGRAWLAPSLVSPEILRDRRADQLAEATALVHRQLPEPPMRVLVKGNGRGLHPRSLRRLGRCPPPPCPRPLPRGSRHTVPPPPPPRGGARPDLLRHPFPV